MKLYGFFWALTEVNPRAASNLWAALNPVVSVLKHKVGDGDNLASSNLTLTYVFTNFRKPKVLT